MPAETYFRLFFHMIVSNITEKWKLAQVIRSISQCSIGEGNLKPRKTMIKTKINQDFFFSTVQAQITSSFFSKHTMRDFDRLFAKERQQIQVLFMAWSKFWNKCFRKIMVYYLTPKKQREISRLHSYNYIFYDINPGTRDFVLDLLFHALSLPQFGPWRSLLPFLVFYPILSSSSISTFVNLLPKGRTHRQTLSCPPSREESSVSPMDTPKSERRRKYSEDFLDPNHYYFSHGNHLQSELVSWDLEWLFVVSGGSPTSLFVKTKDLSKLCQSWQR